MFCLRTKFDSRLKKKFVGKFSKLLEKKIVSLSQNASHTISIYGNFMESIFSKNIINQFFCHQSVQLFSKRRRSGLIFFLLFFENV